jgi:hypothetical protein
LRRIRIDSAFSHIRNIGCETESVGDVFLTSGLTARDAKTTTAVVITKSVDMTQSTEVLWTDPFSGPIVQLIGADLKSMPREERCQVHLSSPE